MCMEQSILHIELVGRETVMIPGDSTSYLHTTAGSVSNVQVVKDMPVDRRSERCEYPGQSSVHSLLNSHIAGTSSRSLN